MLSRLIVALSVIALAIGAVVELTQDNFAKVVDGSSNVLVEFYAPWCGHCKNLAPEWKTVGDTFQPEDSIVIAAIDATAAPEVAAEHVNGYPTIKYFAKGSKEPEEYKGGRTADDIVKWVNDKVGTSRRVKVLPSAVTALTTETFDNLVLGDKAALVEFYAPWCGHCKQLAPKYESLAKAFKGESGVLIAKVDATEHEELASRYEVGGYPTIKFFPAGSSKPIDYNGGREVADMVNFINEQAGTSRNEDGSISARQGRIVALDDIINAASSYDNDLVSKLTEAVASLSDTKDKDYGKLYLSAAGKVASKGEGYPEKEIRRLTGMISSPSVTPESKLSFQVRRNIMYAFVKGFENKDVEATESA